MLGMQKYRTARPLAQIEGNYPSQAQETNHSTQAHLKHFEELVKVCILDHCDLEVIVSYDSRGSCGTKVLDEPELAELAVK
jgi:hypothetical protein